MNGLPELRVLSVKIPVSDLSASRTWYAEVLGLHEQMEWPDAQGIVRGVAMEGLGDVLLALREDAAAAVATRHFGFLNVAVPEEQDLVTCVEHLDRLGVRHTGTVAAATGVLVGFHDLDGHELSFYARTTAEVRDDALRRVRATSVGQRSGLT